MDEDLSMGTPSRPCSLREKKPMRVRAFPPLLRKDGAPVFLLIEVSREQPRSFTRGERIWLRALQKRTGKVETSASLLWRIDRSLAKYSFTTRDIPLPLPFPEATNAYPFARSE